GYNAGPVWCSQAVRSSPLTIPLRVLALGMRSAAMPSPAGPWIARCDLICCSERLMTQPTGFDSLGLHEALTRAVRDAGYENATEVQARAIPPALEGADLRVCSSTGSGKTASFVLPALQRVLQARADKTQRRDKGVVYGPR